MTQVGREVQLRIRIRIKGFKKVILKAIEVIYKQVENTLKYQ